MFTVGIVGGGFCGLLTAWHLLKNSEQPVRVNLFNYSYPAGQGVAYGTREYAHILNVPAGKMSALPEDPLHFSNWVRLNHPELDTETLDSEYLPRPVYGEYLMTILNEIKENKNFSVVNDEIIDIERRESQFVLTGEKNRHEVNSIVLATGNLLPANLVDFESEHYISDPWKFDILKEKAQKANSIFIAGTGLSMVDVMVFLENENIEKPVTAISSGGLLPLEHHAGKAYPSYIDELNSGKDINEIYSIIKKHLKKSREDGYTFQAVIEVLRPYVQEIWLKLDTESRERFLRHLKHGWNVLRHRIPVQTSTIIQKWMNNGKLRIIAGKATYSQNVNGIDVSVKKKKEGVETIESCLLINCTGPLMNYHKVESPLYKNLFRRSLAAPGSLGLGLNATSHGNLLDHYENEIKNLYTIGPTLKSVLWETTAVNEIRSQAKKLAKTILIKNGLIA